MRLHNFYTGDVCAIPDGLSWPWIILSILRLFFINCHYSNIRHSSTIATERYRRDQPRRYLHNGPTLTLLRI
jgi:hypothetical protein